MKKRIIAIAMASMLCLSITACGGEKKETAAKESTKETAAEVTSETVAETVADELVIVESGYYVEQPVDGEAYIYYGIIIENKSKDKIAEYPKYTVTAKSDAGSIIATGDQVLSYIYPGDTIAYGSQVDCKGTVPATVEFTIGKCDFVKPGSDSISISQLPVSNISEIIGDYKGSYTGEVENTSSSDIDMAAGTVILRKEGAIVYGATGYIDDVTAGSKKPFEISAYSSLPEHDAYEVYAQPWM